MNKNLQDIEYRNTNIKCVSATEGEIYGLWISFMVREKTHCLEKI